MIYVWKNKVIVVCLVISLLTGIFVGYGIENNFIVLYMNKFSSNSLIYILLVLIIYSENTVFNCLNSSFILMRKKSHLCHFLHIFKYEVIILVLIFFIMHIPIFIFNYSSVIKYIYIVFFNFLNFVIVSLLILSIIKFVDAKIKSREKSGLIVLVIFSAMHLLFEELIFIGNIGFTLNYIFVLPFVYQHYFVIMPLLVFIIIIFNLLFLLLSLKWNYYLGCDFYEKV